LSSMFGSSDDSAKLEQWVRDTIDKQDGAKQEDDEEEVGSKKSLDDDDKPDAAATDKVAHFSTAFLFLSAFVFLSQTTKTDDKELPKSSDDKTPKDDKQTNDTVAEKKAKDDKKADKKEKKDDKPRQDKVKLDLKLAQMDQPPLSTDHVVEIKKMCVLEKNSLQTNFLKQSF